MQMKFSRRLEVGAFKCFEFLSALRIKRSQTELKITTHYSPVASDFLTTRWRMQDYSNVSRRWRITVRVCQRNAISVGFLRRASEWNIAVESCREDDGNYTWMSNKKVISYDTIRISGFHILLRCSCNGKRSPNGNVSCFLGFYGNFSARFVECYSWVIDRVRAMIDNSVTWVLLAFACDHSNIILEGLVSKVKEKLQEFDILCRYNI